MTKKKITRVTEDSDNLKRGDEAVKSALKVEDGKKVFVPSDENKKRASSNRMIAFLLFIAAIAFEVASVLQLRKVPYNMVLIIVFIVIDAVLAIGGSLLWKKANRLDPASEQNKFKFFVQNQLGLIMAVIAFLPLVILVMTNEDLEKKDKNILAIVAVIAMVVAGFFGTDLNPVSQEQYAEEIALAEALAGDTYEVYWTQHGKVYHLYEDCHHINRDVTTEIFAGKVTDAYEHKNIGEMCKTCKNRAEKELDVKAEDLIEIDEGADN